MHHIDQLTCVCQLKEVIAAQNASYLVEGKIAKKICFRAGKRLISPGYVFSIISRMTYIVSSYAVQMHLTCSHEGDMEQRESHIRKRLISIK